MHKSAILKSLLALVPVFLIALGLPFVINRLTDLKERQTTESQASNPGGTTSFNLVPASGVVVPGSTLPVNVQMSIGTTPANLGITGLRAVLTLNNTTGLSLAPADIDTSSLTSAVSSTPANPPPNSPHWIIARKDVVTVGANQTITIEALWLDSSVYTSATPVTLAVLNLHAGSVVTSSSLIFSAGSEIRAKADNSDILSSTFAAGNYAVAVPTATPTLVPTPTRTPTPIPPTTTPTRTPTPIPPSPTPTRTPTPVPPTSTPVVPTPTVTPPPPTSTPPPSFATLNFAIAFQGVSSAVANKAVTVDLYQGGVQRYHYTGVNVVADSSGVFTGAVGNIAPGSYDVYIKGPIHLRKKLTASPINLSSGVNNQNWSANRLLVGDLNDSNTLQLDDITSVVAVWILTDTPVTPQNQIYDIDDNGIINLSDVTALVANWTTTIVNGD